MIKLDAKVEMAIVNIINLDIEIKVFTIKIITDLIFEINDNNKYIKMLLIKQSMIVFF